MSDSRMEEPYPSMTHEQMKAAELYACRKHEGQMYGENEPYAFHLHAVANNVLTLWGRHVDPVVLRKCYVAAWLHDVVEDTDATIADIFDLFGGEISNVVALLTKPTDFDSSRPSHLVNYLSAIRRNEMARMVKVADALANYTASVQKGELGRMMKYHNLLTTLVGNWRITQVEDETGETG